MTPDTEDLLWRRFNEWFRARRTDYPSEWDAYQAGHAAAKAETPNVGEPVAWRLTNTAFRGPKFEYHSTQELAKQRQEDFNRSVDDGGLHDLTPLYTADQLAAAQADSGAAPAGGANWQDISTAPKDGTRFVAVGQNYGLDSEAQHTCMAQWFRGCWIEVSEWNEISELKYLTHWMPLPPLPCSAARKQGGAT